MGCFFSQGNGYAQTFADRNRLDFLQVTTHPDADLSPRVSPDGKWLAYVSRQSGNLDIWVRNISSGISNQITLHKADDYYPTWYRDNRTLLFVSQRSDAAGDIWKVRLHETKGRLEIKGSPEQITTYQGYDSYPTVSPRGGKLAWVSDRSGSEEIWARDESGGFMEQLTFLGGTHPAWSPNPDLLAFTSFRDGQESNGDIFLLNTNPALRTRDDSLSGQLEKHPVWQVTHGPAMDGFPCWSHDAGHIVFMRYAFDTNRDGVISPTDRASLWETTIFESLRDTVRVTDPMLDILAQSFNLNMVDYAMPLTSGGENVTQPWAGNDGRVYFTSERGGNPDIWSFPIVGYIPMESGALAQYNFAETTFLLPPHMTRQTLGPMFLNWSADSLTGREQSALWERQFAFRRILDFYGTDTPVSAQAFYEMAVCFRLLGYPEQAKKYIDILVEHYADNRSLTAYAEMLELGMDAGALSDTQARLALLRPELEKLLEEYSDVDEPHAAAMIQIGDLLFGAGQDAGAFRVYEQVLTEHPQLHYYCAEAQLKIGDVFKRFATRDEVIQAYLRVVQDYPEQRSWTVPARDRILDLLVTSEEDQVISRYREIVGQYAQFPLLAAEAQLRIGEILVKSGEYNAALQEYDMVESLFGDLVDEVFAANMAKAGVLIKTHDYLQAFSLLEQLETTYSADRADLAAQARELLLTSLLESGDELKAGLEFNLALLRYKRARDLYPNNLSAHRGYIECLYYLRRIDEALVEYNQLVRENPNSQVILYCLGLAYSFKGTERAELYNDPDAVDRNMLKRSNEIINRALSFDYTLVQPYLTLSYNYEVIEQAQARERAKSKPFLVNVWNTVTAPLASVYKTITFRKEQDDRGNYEKAIHELTKAIGLNDEVENPTLEASLALNLANNYYNLGEYGYEKAYQYYHLKLKYDSTFAGNDLRALIYERMGHCALITEDVKGGEIWLLRAIKLYTDLQDEPHVLLNYNRLALLYQNSDLNEQAVDYFQKSAEIQERNKMSSALMRSYRSIALNYLIMDEPTDALYYAKKALDILESGQIPNYKNKAKRVKLEMLGLNIPVPFLDVNNLVPMAALDFTTRDEWALVYTILGNSYSLEKNYDQAVASLEKKIELYKKEPAISATILNNIGYLYFLNGDYTRAWDTFSESLALCEKEKITRGILVNSSNLARIVLAMNNALRENQLDYASVGTQFWGYYDTAARRINSSLDLIGEEEFRYARTKVQLYRFLADFSQIRHDDRRDLADQVESTLQSLENAVFAQTYLQEALRISREYEITEEECSVLYDLGKMLYMVGNSEESYVNLVEARRLAIRNAYYDQLWRIDSQLGDLLAVMPRQVKRKYAIQRDAYEYFIEAIQVLEAHPVNISGSNAEIVRNAYQKPYLRAIHYLIAKNDYTGALALAEQMRARLYLDMVSRENIQLRKERHKIYYGNAKFLQKTINDLEIKLLRKRNEFNTPYSEIVEIQKELDQYREEYQDLLNKARDEVPELETLIRTSPVELASMQNRLRGDEAMLYMTLLDDQTVTWLISSRDVQCEQVQIGRDELVRLSDSLCTQLRNGQDTKASIAALLPLLKPVMDNEKINNLVIVPPVDLMLAPWNILLYNNGTRLGMVSFTFSTSMTDYYYAFDKRKIKGQKAYYASFNAVNNPLGTNGYNVRKPEASTRDNSFEAQKALLGQMDVICLDVQGDWNKIDPARSRMGFRIQQSSPAVFSTVDLYSVNLNASLVQIDFDEPLSCQGYSQPFMAWVRAFGYAGTPSLLVSLWPVDAKGLDDFMMLFYRYLLENPAAEALRMTRRDLVQQRVPPEVWAAFQLYGFGGMTRREEQRYVQQGFETQVRRGHSAFNLSEWQDAIQIYERALRMAERRGDTNSMDLLQQRILESAVNGGIWSKAIEIQLIQIEKARSENNIAGVANGYSNLAYFYTQNGNFDEGVEAKSKFTQLAEQYGLTEQEAASLRETGLIYERGGKYENALDLFTQARDKYADLGQEVGQAQCLRDIGRIYFFYQDNYYDALGVQKQALDLFEKQGVSADLVDAVQNLGNTHEKMGNYKQALDYQQQALQYSGQLQDQRLIGLSRQYLANVLWKMGAFQEALEQQKLALAVFEKLGDKRLIQVGYATRGLIALSFGDSKTAMDFETRAHDLAKERHDDKDRATILKNIGMIHRTLNEQDLALYNFQQAAALDSATGSKRGLAYDLRNIAAMRIGMENKGDARELLNKALSISRSISDWRNITQCYLELGRLDQKQGRIDSAITNLGRAAELAEQFYMPDIRWRACRDLGESWKGRDSEQAITYYEQSIDVIESMRSTIKVEEYASGFVDDKLDVYGELIELLLKQERPGKAFSLVERSKSRNFLDMLGGRNISFAPQNRVYLAKRDSLQTLITGLETRLFYLRAQNDSTLAGDIQGIEAELLSVRQQYESNMQTIRGLDPELYDMYTIQPVTVDQLQALLPDSTALVEYYFYDRHVYAWLVTRNNLAVHKTEIDPKQFRQDVFDLRSALDRQLSVSQWSRSFYEKLVAPMKSGLDQVSHIVFIPHGTLHYLPFAVLSPDEQHYLGLEKSLSIAPSATVFGYCLKKGNPLLAKDRRDMPVAAFGDPDLGDHAWDLPFASLEANSLSRYFTHVNTWLGKRASETNLDNRPELPPLILFSCHGVFDDINPMLSALLLAPDSLNDGRLEAREIFGLKMQAFIVAMSACETGLGTIRGGDEVIGLSRSFIYAGASSLLSSLWKVDDLATAVLMKRFFRNLAEGHSRAESLRLAQLVVFKEINPYPAFWAAFTLTGDFR